MALTVEDIGALFSRQGSRLYGGEAISQLDHALQTAWFAERAGGDDAMVSACLLHDLGHLLFDQQDGDLAGGVDDLHQYKVMPFLRPWFPDEVVDAIGLHVDAKRYLCHAEPGYLDRLSTASRLSLALQGGPMTPRQAEYFRARPHAERAVELRRHDDAAKVVGLRTPPLSHFLARVQRLVLVPA